MNTNRITMAHIHEPEVTSVKDFDTFVAVNLNAVTLFFASPAAVVSFAADLIAKAADPDKPAK